MGVPPQILHVYTIFTSRPSLCGDPVDGNLHIIVIVCLSTEDNYHHHKNREASFRPTMNLYSTALEEPRAKGLKLRFHFPVVS